jgi:hypothetical protein
MEERERERHKGRGRRVLDHLWRRKWSTLCIAVLLLSLALPSSGLFGRFPLCLFRRVTGLPCPGCGLSHAFSALSRGEAAQAAFYHPMGPLLWFVAFFASTGIFWPRKTWEEFGALFRRRRSIFLLSVLCFFVLMLLFGSLRILFLLWRKPSWWIW